MLKRVLFYLVIPVLVVNVVIAASIRDISLEEMNEYFVVAKHFPTSHVNHTGAVEKVKLQRYFAGNSRVIYDYKGPKVDKYFPLHIRGMAYKTSHKVIARHLFKINSILSEWSITSNSGYKLEEEHIPISLGELQSVYRIVYNGETYGNLILAKDKCTVYKYVIFGTYLQDEHWWNDVLPRIENVNTL